jgi:CHRD domain-containing protein
MNGSDHDQRINLEGESAMKRHTIPLFVGLLSLLAIFGPPPLALADDEDELKAQLRGFEETPAAVSTVAGGMFRGEISKDQSSIAYELTYSGLESDVRQAHIHFGQRGVGGGISVFLCQTPTNLDPTGLAPSCLGPRSGTVSGTITAANVIGPTGQGIAAGEFAELVRAIRAGVTYANVHSATFPGGEIRGQIRADD